MIKYDFTLDLSTKNTMSTMVGWIRDNSRILEFGSSTGRLTKYLFEEKKCNVTIVEIDEEAGRIASQYAEESFIGNALGDIEKFKWIENIKGKFDYIIFGDVLEHLSQPEKVLKICKEVLEDNGQILVSIPNLSHNSVLIDLMNDEFNYTETGLLDKTHIHFFTYKSFVRMISECELSIDKQDQIYSRVGNNEIDNTYADVPCEVNKYLRGRETGSIYQFVFALIKNENCNIGTTVRPKPLEMERWEQQEGVCYIKESYDDEFSEDKALRILYYSNDNQITYNLESYNHIKEIRWDPMSCNGILKINRIYIKNRSNECKVIDSIQSNAKYTVGSLYVFDTLDPQLIVMPIWDDVKQITFEFELLVYNTEQIGLYNRLFKENQTNTQKQLDAIIDVIKHREQDIDELKKAIERKSIDIEEFRHEIAHRDKDIKDLKEVIVNRDKDVNELNKVIVHRDKDIIELNNVISKYDKEINELGKVVNHRDQDIMELKSELKCRDEIIQELKEIIEQKNNKMDALSEEIMQQRDIIKILKSDIERMKYPISSCIDKIRKKLAKDK